MKKTLFTIALFTVLFASSANAQLRGYASRYWDGCKPHCAWSDADKGGTGPNLCKECNRSNVEINPPTQWADAQRDPSSCQGGGSYTCWDMIPFRDPDDPNKAYAFAATPTPNGVNDCGKCFELTFDGGWQNANPPHMLAYSTHEAIKGKVLIVMSSNIGHDVQGGQFDVMIPGGGVGQFDSFSGQLGINKSDLGKDYGGFLSDCEERLNYGASTLEQYKKCLSDKCDAVFNPVTHALLNEGCNFYADWFEAANNPTITYRRLDSCPDILVERYRVGSGGSEPTPGTTAGGTRYTVTYSVNGGNGTAPFSRTVNEGVSVALAAGSGLTRSGFMFGGWNTSADGSGVTYAVGSSFTPTADVTMYARWIAAISVIDTTRVNLGSGTQNGQTTTYRVNVTVAGDFSIEFSIAGEHYAGFAVRVNNGSQEHQFPVDGGTGGANTFVTRTLDNVRLNAGENTITVNLWGGTIGSILIIGETLVPISVKFNAARVNKARSNVLLRPANRGFTAILPDNHLFESYSLVDLMGREIRKGKVQSGASELHFNNIRQGALFLRLKGKNGTTVLRAATF